VCRIALHAQQHDRQHHSVTMVTMWRYFYIHFNCNITRIFAKEINYFSRLILFTVTLVYQSKIQFRQQKLLSYISSWNACSFIGNGSCFSSLFKLFHSLVTALNRKLLWPDKVFHKGICSNSLFLVTQSWSSIHLLNSSHRYGGASPFMHYFLHTVSFKKGIQFECIDTSNPCCTLKSIMCTIRMKNNRLVISWTNQNFPFTLNSSVYCWVFSPSIGRTRSQVRIYVNPWFSRPLPCFT
jgi:hypothetical protein